MTADHRDPAPSQPRTRRTLAAAAATVVLTALVLACAEATAGAPTAYRLGFDEYRDGRAITPHHLESGCAWWAPYEQWLTPDAARRDTFEIRVSATQVSVGMPD